MSLIFFFRSPILIFFFVCVFFFVVNSCTLYKLVMSLYSTFKRIFSISSNKKTLEKTRNVHIDTEELCLEDFKTKASLPVPPLYFRHELDVHTSCIICWEVFSFKNMRLKTLTCGHTYHHDCLNTWFTYNQTCPYCRSSYIPCS